MDQAENSIEPFYDAFYSKLIGDYLRGNPRIESAIRFACDNLLRANRNRVLDIGFGLGWSSYEYLRAIPQGEVHGIDISSKLTELATAMFGSGENNLRFAHADVTSASWTSSLAQQFDACVMLDLYEHISHDARNDFHRAISNLLTDDAIVILTCPTPLHQDYLRTNEPAGLQPVDEDVTLEVIAKMCKDIGGQLTHYEYKSIWATNDYFHVVISRDVKRQSLDKDQKTSHKLMKHSQRLKHVQRAAHFFDYQTINNLRKESNSLSRRILRKLKRLVRAVES